jgi:hypothetical protein
MFFAVRVQITKGTTWRPDQAAAAGRMVQEARRSGMNALANALDAVEPAEIIGDRLPSHVTHADLRICADCVLKGPTIIRADGSPGGIDLLGLVRSTEIGGPRVPTPEKA